MVACNPPYHVRPSKCYLDVLNIACVNATEKDKIDMPWVNASVKRYLYLYQLLPQRILFDLPFVYYIKLVILFNEHHQLIIHTVTLIWILVV